MAASLKLLGFLILGLILSFSPTTLSQQNPPTVSDCTPRLLPLAPCAPFVQGISQAPVQSCCDNLDQLSMADPACLCLLLTNSSSFPINTTLALQLPALCNSQANASACSVPPAASQVSLGGRTNSSSNSSVAAASPMVQVAPRPTIMGLGFGRSTSVKVKAGSSSVFLVLWLMFF